MGAKAILAVSALWLGAALAYAQPTDGPGGPRKGPGGFVGGRMEKALGLSDDQKAEFQKLLDEQRPQMQALHQQMRENHQKLEDALAGDDPDPGIVGQLVIQGRSLAKQAEAQRKKTSQALRALLNPDQQAKFDALESLRGAGRRGPGFGPGFGGHGRGWGGPAGAPLAPPQN